MMKRRIAGHDSTIARPGEHLDQESLDVFDQLHRRTQSHGKSDGVSGLMCIVMSRASGLEACKPTLVAWGDAKDDDRGAHVHVAPMPDSDVLALVTSQLQGKRLPEDVLRYIVDTCEGCPLYIESLTKAMLTSDLLYLVGGASDDCYELGWPHHNFQL